jgi:hypothetical protein
MRIRIDYFEDIEETDAVHLGEFPDGSGELFRVARPSIAVGGVSREDVVRLEPDGDRYVFFGVVERSAWNTARPLLPAQARDSGDAYVDFTNAIAASGCILDGERVERDGVRIVVSIPPGTSADAVTRAHERLVEQASGVSANEFNVRASDAELQRHAEHHARQRREQIAWQRRERLARIGGRGLRVVAATAFIVAMGWWLYELATAGPLARPRIAALGMIFPLLPTALLTVRDTHWRSFMFGPPAAGVLAYLLAGSPAYPHYAFAATGVGLICVMAAGSVGFLFGIFSGFAANERDLKQVWLFLVLPCAVTTLAAIIYMATAVHAARVAVPV